MRVVHCKRERCTKYIGRGSIYGNPFTHLPVGNTKASVQVGSVDEAVDSTRSGCAAIRSGPMSSPSAGCRSCKLYPQTGRSHPTTFSAASAGRHTAAMVTCSTSSGRRFTSTLQTAARYVPCPVCHSVVGMGISTRNGYQFVRCTSCDHEGPTIQCIQPSSGIDKLTFDAWNLQDNLGIR